MIELLKQTRIERGLSVRGLGKLLDEPHQFVVKIETLERKLNVFEYVQYCQALNLDTNAGLKKLEKKIEEVD